MNDKDKKLLITLLNYLDDIFCNAGCNDIPKEWVEQYSDDELREMFNFVCYDPDDFDECHKTILSLGDNALIRYLKLKINND